MGVIDARSVYVYISEALASGGDRRRRADLGRMLEQRQQFGVVGCSRVKRGGSERGTGE
ncbi:MAG: hypothetical protein ACYC2Z_00110 [Candidatus Nanopelagicales bacterium]